MKFKPAKSEKAQLNSVIVNLDLKTGKALDIKHLNFVEKVY
jgi:calcineurin-like phosphoesterase